MTAQSIRKSLPKAEMVWTTYELDDGRKLYVTSTKLRDKYSLWEKSTNGYVIVMSSVSPRKLIDKAEHELDSAAHTKKRKSKSKGE